MLIGVEHLRAMRLGEVRYVLPRLLGLLGCGAGLRAEHDDVSVWNGALARGRRGEGSGRLGATGSDGEQTQKRDEMEFPHGAWA
ncbi:hypothetical protein MVI01_47730 [Myxococcus virescens]|uniref:Uncharacterized protein n=1 Tax=Myxococcus virescens TaxID=83456 RepID=A0A511HKC4_9BACT|nr:hypothetical protein MVI01_47730 [Myxococcus virescens]